jgi:hypothetical protein
MTVGEFVGDTGWLVGWGRGLGMPDTIFPHLLNDKFSGKGSAVLVRFVTTDGTLIRRVKSLWWGAIIEARGHHYEYHTETSTT